MNVKVMPEYFSVIRIMHTSKQTEKHKQKERETQRERESDRRRWRALSILSADVISIKSFTYV